MEGLRRRRRSTSATACASRIFMVTAIVAALAFGFWFLIIEGPGNAGPEMKRLFTATGNSRRCLLEEVLASPRAPRGGAGARGCDVPEAGPRPHGAARAADPGGQCRHLALRRRMSADTRPGGDRNARAAARRHGLRPNSRSATAPRSCCRTRARSCWMAGELLVAWPGWRPLPDLAGRAGGRRVPVGGAGRAGGARGSRDAGRRALQPQRPHGRARCASPTYARGASASASACGAARRGVRRLPRAGRRAARSWPSCRTCRLPHLRQGVRDRGLSHRRRARPTASWPSG